MAGDQSYGNVLTRPKQTAEEVEQYEQLKRGVKITNDIWKEIDVAHELQQECSPDDLMMWKEVENDIEMDIRAGSSELDRKLELAAFDKRTKKPLREQIAKEC